MVVVVVMVMVVVVVVVVVFDPPEREYRCGDGPADQNSAWSARLQ